MKPLEKSKFGQRIELVFLDHSSNNSWQSTEEIMSHEEFEIQLIGYYVGSTKKSHRFSMAFARNHSGTHAPTFTVLKADVIRWRKVDGK